MKNYHKMSKSELTKELAALNKQKDAYKKKQLKLNMTRGKPAPAQLDLALGMNKVLIKKEDYISKDKIDCRNYGDMTGIYECKKLLGDMCGAKPEQVIVAGNSSLRIMYDVVAHAMIKGVCGNKPFMKQGEVKWLCVVPGYDRHFAIMEYFGIKMINVPLLKDGPDMALVEKLVKDPQVKGIWCVPKYANPSGTSYGPKAIKRLAALKPAAKDFRIYWDNAYTVHHLYPNKRDNILNILDEAKKAHNEDIVYVFASTSKISFAGAGVACVAASEKNLEDLKKNFTVETVGFDKVNQIRHVKFFKNIKGIEAHMKKHANIMRPKFEMVLKVLDKEVGPMKIATYTRPYGGYFISLNTLDGCATRVHALCKEMGVSLTAAGAAYPYHKDPHDSHLRIAPSYPSIQEIKPATEILALAIKIASVEKALKK
ncbi:MAG: aminotransferase class I/II-fold pyridoxal phosphate-dependent enzyme [Bacilli bacterium]|nr:aminotransferase class I/II-fold pyridoxal phosphate-dependent enzyme [Bacilli bacterium]